MSNSALNQSPLDWDEIVAGNQEIALLLDLPFKKDERSINYHWHQDWNRLAQVIQQIIELVKRGDVVTKQQFDTNCKLLTLSVYESKENVWREVVKAARYINDHSKPIYRESKT